MAKEKISDSHDDVHTCTDREKGEKAELSGGKSQYEKSKEKNVAELQDILADLNAKFPMPAELGEKVSKTQTAKKKQEKNEKKEVRRESQRNKDKIGCVTSYDDQYP